jgi:BMFP domain-containing protein YqiC
LPETSYKNMCSILAELHLNYRNVRTFEEFVVFADQGLRLAHEIQNNHQPSNNEAEQIIRKTFEDFLADMDLEDEGFESLEDILVSEVDE